MTVRHEYFLLPYLSTTNDTTREYRFLKHYILLTEKENVNLHYELPWLQNKTKRGPRGHIASMNSTT